LLTAHPLLVLQLQRNDFVLYPFVGVLAGLAGAHWGAWAHEKARATERALRATVDALNEAEDEDGVAAAVGEHFGREAGIVWVTVWTAREGAGTEEYPGPATTSFEVRGRWAQNGAEKRLPPPGARLGAPTLPAVALPDAPVFGPRQPELLRDAEDLWGARDPHPVLGYRLVTVGQIVGLLVFSRGPDGAPSDDDGRAYAVVASTAAMALDRVRLWGEASYATRLEEHRRMANELHDTLAQGFVAIRKFLSGMNPPGEAEDLRLWELAKATAWNNLAEARRLVSAYRDYDNPGLSLGSDLEDLARRWSEEHRVPARAGITGAPVGMSAEAHHALKRAAQEALTNAAKHARATEVRVTLSFEEDLVLLDVRDDGVGFDAVPDLPPARRYSSPEDGGQGLVSMRDRLERLGGILSVESEPGEGTTVTVEMPVPKGAAPDGDSGFVRPGRKGERDGDSGRGSDR
jgi:signal transduction histidine kinase